MWCPVLSCKYQDHKFLQRSHAINLAICSCHHPVDVGRHEEEELAATEQLMSAQVTGLVLTHAILR